MAWCEACEAAWTPVGEGPSACPQCGTAACGPSAGTTGETTTGEAPARLPWHLKGLLAALVAYLGWRAVQGVLVLLGVLG
ncbi:MAG: hypothetical protein FJW83_07745 [Actinobacteria bacterium]|nr:hypothetical protein [Actinomycetota bacterium]